VVIGDMLGDFGVKNSQAILQGTADEQTIEKFFNQDWNQNVSLTIATVRALSNGFSQQVILRQYSNWWRNGDFSRIGQIDDSNFENEITSILNFELMRNVVPSKNNDGVQADFHILVRLLPMIVYENASNKSRNFFQNEQAFQEISDFITITNDDTPSILGGLLFSVFFQAIINGRNIYESLENSIGFSFEFFSRRALFQSELNYLQRLNFPDFKSVDIERMPQDNHIFSVIEQLYWLLYRTETFEVAKKLVDKNFKDNREILYTLLFVIFNSADRKNLNDFLIDGLDNQTKIVEDNIRIANRSGRFKL
jgi:hypothetical protein